MERRKILLASFSHFVCDINTGALPALLPYLIGAHGMSYSAASGLVLANSSLASVIQPAFGLMADRNPRPWLMPAGIAIAGVSMALVGVLHSYAALFLATACGGIGAALFHPAGLRFATAVSGTARGTGTSLFSVGGNMGFLLAPLIAVLLINLWGLPGLLILAPLALAMAALTWHETARLVSGDPAAAAMRTDAQPRNDWPAFFRLTGNIVCRSVVMVCLRIFVPLYWIARFGQDEASAALALTLFGAFGIGGNLAGGFLADRCGYRRVIRGTHAALVPLLAAFPFIQSFPLAYAVLLAVGFLLYASFSPVVVLGQRYLARNVGFASGITLGLGISVGGLFAPVLGWVADACGLEAAFHAMSGCIFLGALFAFALAPVGSDRDA